MAKIAVTPTIVLAEFVLFRKKVSCQKVIIESLHSWLVTAQIVCDSSWGFIRSWIDSSEYRCIHSIQVEIFFMLILIPIVDEDAQISSRSDDPSYLSLAFFSDRCCIFLLTICRPDMIFQYLRFLGLLPCTMEWPNTVMVWIHHPHEQTMNWWIETLYMFSFRGPQVPLLSWIIMIETFLNLVWP